MAKAIEDMEQLKKRSKTETAYFVLRKEQMQYSAFKKAGWPIGSGAVESRMRRIVNLRLGVRKMFKLQAVTPNMCCSCAVMPRPGGGSTSFPWPLRCTSFAHTLKHKKRGRSRHTGARELFDDQLPVRFRVRLSRRPARQS